jgi:hypothetical protein
MDNVGSVTTNVAIASTPGDSSLRLRMTEQRGGFSRDITLSKDLLKPLRIPERTFMQNRYLARIR